MRCVQLAMAESGTLHIQKTHAPCSLDSVKDRTSACGLSITEVGKHPQGREL